MNSPWLRCLLGGGVAFGVTFLTIAFWLLRMPIVDDREGEIVVPLLMFLLILMTGLGALLGLLLGSINARRRKAEDPPGLSQRD